MSAAVTETIQSIKPWSTDQSGQPVSVNDKAEATGAEVAAPASAPDAAAATPANSTGATATEPAVIEASGVPPSATESAPLATETAPVATTMYTSETPAVVESSDHHLVGESLPITHTRIPDYDEQVKPAPAILNNDLASILRSGANVTQDTTYLTPRNTYGSAVVDELAAETTPAPAATTEYETSKANTMLPESEIYASSTGKSGDGEVPLNEATRTASVEPTSEQPWSVRGPPGVSASETDASTAQVQGKDVSATTTADATAADAVPASSAADADAAGVDAAKSTGSEATGAANHAASDATGAAGGAASGATDAAKNTASGATDGAKNAASGVTDGAKNAASGATDQAKNAVNTGKEGVSDLASKPKKLGFMGKVKKALHIGKEAK